MQNRKRLKMIRLQKGAMFGLDARIALAIFGALSVISGAALYSAIQNSKVTVVVADLTELAKAVEAYVLDTGSDVLVHAGDQAKIILLVDNTESIANWNGPYISGYSANAGTPNALPSSKYTGVHLLNFRYHNAGSTRAQCSAGNICYAWIHITGIPTGLVKDIDTYFDGSYDLTSGRLQGSDYSSIVAGTHALSLKVMPLLVQP